MTHPPSLATNALVHLAEVTNRTFVLPVVIFYPTSRCNSRCASCSWWESTGADDLTLQEIETVASALPALGTSIVVFSGGEPLLRPDVFEAARIFRQAGVSLHLLTSGLMLERDAEHVARQFSRVIISLDATTEDLYRHVRGVTALTTVERGVARLRRMAPDIPITARSTLHRVNYREASRLVEHARAMALDGISFLPADVSSTAFGRERAPERSRLGLDRSEISEFRALIEEMIAVRRDDFASGFIAESPDKLRRLPQYYAALGGDGSFPAVACNAPYMSAVVEASGDVRPCFFHDAIGNVRSHSLGTIVARDLPAFRRTLDVTSNPVCVRCVCSMRTGWRHAPWQ